MYAAQLYGGQEITLTATEETGWLTKSMADALLLRSRTPGLVMPFTFHDELVGAQVVFRHNDEPAIDLTPLTPRKAMGESDYFIGTIKLLCI